MRKFIVYILMTSIVLSSCVISKIEPPETTEIEEETTETSETREKETEIMQNIDELSKYNPFGYPTAIMRADYMDNDTDWMLINYDDDGNLTEIRHMLATEDSFTEKGYWLMSYDEKGRLLSESKGRKKGQEKYVVRYKYTDDENRKETFNYSSGELNWIANEIFDDEGEVIDYKQYDADGRLCVQWETSYPDDVDGVDKIRITKDFRTGGSTQLEYFGERMSGQLYLYKADYLGSAEDYDSFSFDYSCQTEEVDGIWTDYYITASGFIDDEYGKEAYISVMLHEKTGEPGEEIIYSGSIIVEGKRNLDRLLTIEDESFSVNVDVLEELIDVKNNAETITMLTVVEGEERRITYQKIEEMKTDDNVPIIPGESKPEATDDNTHEITDNKLEINGKTYVKFCETITGIDGSVSEKYYYWDYGENDICLESEYYDENLYDESGNEIMSKNIRKYHGVYPEVDELYVTSNISITEYSESNKILHTSNLDVVGPDGIIDYTDIEKFDNPSLDHSMFYDYINEKNDYRYICDSKGREIITIKETYSETNSLDKVVQVYFPGWFQQGLFTITEIESIYPLVDRERLIDGRTTALKGENGEILIFYPESEYVGVVEQ